MAVGRDGSWPVGGLARDRHGNLYGSTYLEGAYEYGVVFKLKPNGKFRVLHAFGGGNGRRPSQGGGHADEQAGQFVQHDGEWWGTRLQWRLRDRL